LERATDLNMLISFPFSVIFDERSVTLSEWMSVDIKIIGQVCLRGSELKKSYI
jgi:hypothetical protein